MRIVAKGKESKLQKHPSKSHSLEHKKERGSLLRAYKMIPSITNIMLREIEEQAIGKISLSNDTDGHSPTTVACSRKEQLLPFRQALNWKNPRIWSARVRSCQITVRARGRRAGGTFVC